MKKMKQIKTILIAAALLCCAMILGACGEGGDKNYKVAVKDAFGTPYTDGVVVLFLQNGEQVAMQVVNPESGVAEKTLPAGDYDVKLKFTNADAEFYYEEDAYKLTAKETEAEVLLHQAVAGNPYDLFVGAASDSTGSAVTSDQGRSYEAYDVHLGSTYVELTPGDRTYFVFTPSEAGMYEISIPTQADLHLGYYGVTHFVRATSISEPVDGKIQINITKSMVGSGDFGTTNLVIGIDADTSDACILGIQRTGDAEKTIEEEPWVVYEAKDAITEYTLPEGTVLKEFDVTADSYEIVYNEADGYYHLNSADGPLVYMSLVEDNKYMSSFKTIMVNAGVSKYYYDAEGKFEKRVSFVACLQKYIEAADDKAGVYPLNEDLFYILKEHGGYAGWWDLGSKTSIFVDDNWNPLPGINEDIAWLFMCLYGE